MLDGRPCQLCMLAGSEWHKDPQRRFGQHDEVDDWHMDVSMCTQVRLLDPAAPCRRPHIRVSTGHCGRARASGTLCHRNHATAHLCRCTGGAAPAAPCHRPRPPWPAARSRWRRGHPCNNRQRARSEIPCVSDHMLHDPLMLCSGDRANCISSMTQQDGNVRQSNSLAGEVHKAPLRLPVLPPRLLLLNTQSIGQIGIRYLDKLGSDF